MTVHGAGSRYARDPAGPHRRAVVAALGAACLGPDLLRARSASARVALVIGNAGYPRAPLRNPLNDARAIGQALGRLGFSVTTVRDADKSTMDRAIAQTADALRGRAGVGLLYYAGHGVQVDWRNYLLPVDAEPGDVSELRQRAVDLQQALQALSGDASRTSIVVLDACRDNPFGPATSAAGLAPMDAPPGTFIAYATAPGHVAEDGSSADGHGLYTRYLLQELEKPQVRLEDVFKRVRLHVRRATRGRQIPSESTSLTEDIVLASGAVVAPPRLSEREAALEAERAAWTGVAGSSRAEDYFAFLQRFPSGTFSELAQFRLDRLARPQVQPLQPPAERVVMLPPGSDRFRVGDRWQFERTHHLESERREKLDFAVTAIEGGRVLLNDGAVVLDQMGNVLEDGFGRKDPGVLIAPSELHLGKRWRTAFTNMTPGDFVSERNFFDVRVEGLEELDLPIGRVRAFKVVAEGIAVRPDTSTRLESIHWIDPARMTFVRVVLRFTDSARGWVVHHTTDELVRSSRGATT